MKASPKAAFICIGNEILSGKTQDSNLQVLAKWLNQQGVRLEEARVIADIEAEIIETVIEMSKKYQYVFTSGGIGPTHDDITSESIAKAFEVPIILDQLALSALVNHYGSNQDITDARKKMAYLPQGALHIKNPVSGAVGFSIDNVFVLAGVPSVFKAMLKDITSKIAGGDLWHSHTLEVYCGESRIAADLSYIQDRHPQVEIGSYPKYAEDKKYYTELVFRSQNKQENASTLDETLVMLESNSIDFS